MDDFVKEFHQRQRLAQRDRKKTSRFFESVGHWFHELNAAKWAYPLGISYALVMMWLLLSPSHDTTVRGNSAVPVYYPAPTPSSPTTVPNAASEKGNEQHKELPEKPSATGPF